MSSVHELVEEAQRIASEVDERSSKKPTKKVARVSDKMAVKTPAATVTNARYADMKASEGDVKPIKSKRTVDEIIATLHDQSDA